MVERGQLYHVSGRYIGSDNLGSKYTNKHALPFSDYIQFYTTDKFVVNLI